MNDDNISPDDARRNQGLTLGDKLTDGDSPEPDEDSNTQDVSEPRQDETAKDDIRFTLDMPPELHQELKAQAVVKENRSMKAVVIDALRRYLES